MLTAGGGHSIPNRKRRARMLGLKSFTARTCRRYKWSIRGTLFTMSDCTKDAFVGDHHLPIQRMVEGESEC